MITGYVSSAQFLNYLFPMMNIALTHILNKAHRVMTMSLIIIRPRDWQRYPAAPSLRY